jgi:hypothetical protein
MRSAMRLAVVSEGLGRSLASGCRFKATKVAIPLGDEIDRYAQYQPTTLSLQNFVDICKYSLQPFFMTEVCIVCVPPVFEIMFCATSFGLALCQSGGIEITYILSLMECVS